MHILYKLYKVHFIVYKYLIGFIIVCLDSTDFTWYSFSKTWFIFFRLIKLKILKHFKTTSGSQ